jgi:lipoprotein-anchoring transpeptidase ErfK/SrfK
MRRTLILTLALLLVPAAQAGAQTPARIAAGVSAAGTDLSGLTLDEAAARLYSADATSLGRPLSVHVAGRAFPLVPADLKLGLDGLKTAHRAFNAGRAPHTGNVDVALFVTYDTDAVRSYTAKIAAALHRDPRDASVNIGLHSIAKVASRDGRDLDATALTATVAKTLADPRLDRIVRPAPKVVKPKVTTAGLASSYGTIITIDRGEFKLRLFKRLKLSKTYRVAVGQPAYPTPTGRFSIQNKAVNPTWSVPDSPWAGALRNETVAGGSDANPLKARWMGIVNGVGIHGTGESWSVGTRASHGCIRMTVPDVVDLYPRVPVGTPVVIGD